MADIADKQTAFSYTGTHVREKKRTEIRLWLQRFIKMSDTGRELGLEIYLCDEIVIDRFVSL